VIASAQDTTTTTQTTTIDVDDDDAGDADWFASGFVGSNFGQDAADASVDFGGNLGFLWNGAIGAEFLANLSPDFELEPARRALLLGDQPWINSYMLNLIGAIPVGGDSRFQPFISGGVGALTLRSNVLLSDDGDNELTPDDSRFGGNIGAGIMGFGGNVGVRADFRYFRGFGDSAELNELDPVETPAEAVGNRVLSGLDFWRANIGVAFRW
jgi:hypothetical protein